MIVIVDYGMGNLKSVENAALFLGKKAKVSDSGHILKKASKIILPGVGHFKKAVQELEKRKLLKVLKDRLYAGVPFLGICLGMQLLLDKSQEAQDAKGLGVIKGEVRKFSAKDLVVPHMGWNQLTLNDKKEQEKGIFKGIKNGSFFYFAHSYYCRIYEEKEVLATTSYGIDFVSSLHKNNIWAVQFHPEKSQKLGLKVFKNFLDL